MALLTIQQLRELSKTKDKRKKVLSSLSTAKSHSQDIRLHTEAEVADNSSNPAYSRFLKRVSGYLVEDKFKVFKKYHRFPMATTATCSSILQQLNKVFDGKNAIRSATYANERVEADNMAFLEQIEFNKRWRTESSRAMASNHNSILVVDMPRDKPEPYFYFLPIDSVEDMDVDRDGNLLWVQFYQEDGMLTHVSNDGWQVLKTSGKKGGEIVSIEYEAANTTGKKVLDFFWEDNMKTGDKVLKKSPFSEWISKLDWLEVWACWKRMLDADGIAPVTWSIEEDCDFRDDKDGIFCDGGYLKRVDGTYVRGASSYIDGGYKKCPKCSDKRFTAPGSHMEVPPPDKESDLREPFGRVTIDKDSLDNAREEEIRLKEEIIKGITGGGQEPMNQEAINVTQVSALFEGWTGVLRQIKKSFERSEEWVLETMAALRYGADVLDMFINYGNDFYLLSEQEALSFYTAAREMGLPDYILDFLLAEYYKTKFRFDKQGFERVKVLMAIEPFKHVTKTKLLDMVSKNIPISREDIYLKLNFGSLVQRFEIENGNVAEFGLNMEGRGNTFAARVAKIKAVMVSYIPEAEKAPEIAPNPVNN